MQIQLLCSICGFTLTHRSRKRAYVSGGCPAAEQRENIPARNAWVRGAVWRPCTPVRQASHSAAPNAQFLISTFQNTGTGELSKPRSPSCAPRRGCNYCPRGMWVTTSDSRFWIASATAFARCDDCLGEFVAQLLQLRVVGQPNHALLPHPRWRSRIADPIPPLRDHPGLVEDVFPSAFGRGLLAWRGVSPARLPSLQSRAADRS